MESDDLKALLEGVVEIAESGDDIFSHQVTPSFVQAVEQGFAHIGITGESRWEKLSAWDDDIKECKSLLWRLRRVVERRAHLATIRELHSHDSSQLPESCQGE